MEEQLERYGLTKKEAKVYITCLTLKSSSVTEIAQKSGVYRTLCYEVLENLMHLGLVSFVIKDNKKYFQAADPEKLINILKEKEELIKDILPSLKKLRDYKKEDLNVEIYKDVEGIKTILRDSLKGETEIQAWGLNKQIETRLPIFISQYKNILKRKKIKIKMFSTDEKDMLDIPNSENKIIPKTYSTPVTTLTFGHKVAMILTEPLLTGILIENSEISKSFSDRFDLLWNQSIIVYEGDEVKTALWNQIKAKKELKIFGAKGRFRELYPEFSKKYLDFQIKNKIITKILYPKKIKASESKFTEIRYLPEGFQFPVSTTLFDNKVHLLIWDPKPQSILISNKIFFDSYEKYFDELWNLSTKISS